MLSVAPETEPTPMTVEGTHALIERFHALKRLLKVKSIVKGFPRDYDN